LLAIEIKEFILLGIPLADQTSKILPGKWNSSLSRAEKRHYKPNFKKNEL